MVNRNIFKAATLSCIFVLAAFAWNNASAETTDFSAIVALIKENDLDKANELIDAILIKEQNNVNALMYKGKVLLFKGSNIGGVQVYGNDDESIYNSDIGEIGEGSSLTTPEVAKNIAVYFNRALGIAPQRMDIQLGLCWSYANAGMKDELIGRFPALIRYSGNKPGLQYNMGDYARIIVDNYSFDDGIAVYRGIARLYPNDGNIINDIGAMYLTKKGDLDTALKYFKQAASMKNRDDATLTNFALVAAMAGNYDQAAQAQKMLSAFKKDTTYRLFDALKKRLKKQPGWQEEVQTFIKENKDKTNYKGYVEFAGTLLPDAGKFTLSQYKASRQKDVPLNFHLINDEWAAQEFPDQFDAVFPLADTLTFNQNYRKALVIFDHIEKAKLAKDPEVLEQVNLRYAWALYRAGKTDAANERWKVLLDSKDFYRKSAASYFLGNYYYKNKDYKEAAGYFKRVKNDASKSKYANYSSNLYGAIENAK